ncbi:MAG: type IX secretion system protein PorQ [Bacteroidales bacterium]|nr:type IX secretion system protein PorQ [Bacteroidales bacterium]
MKNQISLIVLFIIIPFISKGQSGGLGVYSFLQLPKSSHISAIGGTCQSIISNDLSTVFHNPALLNDSVINHITLFVNKYFSDIYYGNFAYATKIFNKYNIFTGINYLNYGKFIRTDECGNIYGNFYASDYVLNISFSNSIVKSNLNYGIAFKPLISVYDRTYSFGTCFDFSMLYYNTNNNISLSLAINNIGIQIIPYTKGNFEPVKYSLNFSVSKRFVYSPFYIHASLIELQNFKLSNYKNLIDKQKKPEKLFSDTSFKRINKIESFATEFIHHVVIGTDVLITKNFYFSVGYNFKRRYELATEGKKRLTGFSWGVGLKIYKLQIHFSRSKYHIAQAINMITINTNLNEFIKNSQ